MHALAQVVEEAELAACCRKHAKELLGLSPKGLRLTKWLLNHSQEGRGDGAGYRTGWQILYEVGSLLLGSSINKCIVGTMSPCLCDGLVMFCDLDGMESC